VGKRTYTFLARCWLIHCQFFTGRRV